MDLKDELKSLEELDLRLNNITRLEHLEPLENLEKLSLIGNFIEIIENVSNNSSLTHLSLGNLIHEIDVSAMPNTLKELNIIGDFTSIEGLDALKKLEKLNLTGNFSDLHGITNLKELKYLLFNPLDEKTTLFNIESLKDDLGNLKDIRKITTRYPIHFDIYYKEYIEVIPKVPGERFLIPLTKNLAEKKFKEALEQKSKKRYEKALKELELAIRLENNTEWDLEYLMLLLYNDKIDFAVKFHDKKTQVHQLLVEMKLNEIMEMIRNYKNQVNSTIFGMFFAGILKMLYSEPKFTQQLKRYFLKPTNILNLNHLFWACKNIDNLTPIENEKLAEIKNIIKIARNGLDFIKRRNIKKAFYLINDIILDEDECIDIVEALAQKYHPD